MRHRPRSTPVQFRCCGCGQKGGWVETKNPDGTVGVSLLHGFHPENSTIACDRCGEHLRAESNDRVRSQSEQSKDEIE